MLADECGGKGMDNRGLYFQEILYMMAWLKVQSTIKATDKGDLLGPYKSLYTQVCNSLGNMMLSTCAALTQK